MRNILILLAVFANISFCKANDEKSNAKADITNITVYRLGAEIQQSFKATVKKETQFIEISNVSNSLEKNSLQIKSDNNITILGFEFSNSFLGEEIKSFEYQKLEDSLNKITKAANKLGSTLTTLHDLITVLNSNKEIKGNQSGLSITELMKLMDYYKSKSIELKNEIDDINEKIIKINEVAKKLKDQMAEEKKKEYTKRR